MAALEPGLHTLVTRAQRGERMIAAEQRQVVDFLEAMARGLAILGPIYHLASKQAAEDLAAARGGLRDAEAREAPARAKSA